MANLSNINNKFLVTTTGEVLVGRTAATGTSKLQVSGSLLIGTDINSGIPLVVQETTADGFAIGFMRNTNATNGNGLVIDVNSTGGAYIQDWRQASTVKMRLLQNGNLGIGTPGPSVKLDVVGSGKFQPGIADGDALVTIAQTNSNAYVHAGIKINAGNTNPFYIYQSGSSNTLRFNYNSLADAGGQLVITDSGNVGIGTDSPAKKLEVAVTGNNQASTVRIQGTDGNGAGHPLDLKMDGATDTFSILIGQGGGATPSTVLFSGNRNGNVGIGDTSPQGKLEVSQNMSNGAASAFTSPHLRLSALNTTDSTGFVGMTFATSSANNYGFSWGALRTVSALGGMHLRYHGNSASGTDIFNIDYVGNVTIASTRYIRSDSSGGYLTIQGGATFPGGRIDMYGGSSASAGIEFMTGGATGSPTLRLRIDGDTDDSYFTGNLGIGTTTVQNKFVVRDTGSSFNSTIQTSTVSIISKEMTDNAYHSILQLVAVRQSLTTGNASNGYLGFSTVDDSNNQGQLDAGRIAIRNEAGSSRNSATALSFWTNPGGTQTTAAVEKMRITSGGRILMPGLDGKTQVHPDVSYRTSDGELFYQTSSERYKTDIVDLENCLDKVNSLRTVRFTDTNTNEPGFGLIAEETNEIIPDVVFSKNEQIEGISYSNLVPFLIKSIQELKAEIELLKSK